VLGNGFALTDASHGVNFDLDSDGVAERLSWTRHNSDEGFLSLDRNGNWQVDSGLELFGNYTPQPVSNNPNGFLALAEFDKSENGGNEDGIITSADAIFGSLRIWQDTNHNGISEPGESRSWSVLGIHTLSLNYTEARRRDQYGNLFAYRSRFLSGPQLTAGRWAYDVFLVRGQ
jgi:hypothetical protein